MNDNHNIVIGEKKFVDCYLKIGICERKFVIGDRKFVIGDRKFVIGDRKLVIGDVISVTGDRNLVIAGVVFGVGYGMTDSLYVIGVQDIKIIDVDECYFTFIVLFSSTIFFSIYSLLH